MDQYMSGRLDEPTRRRRRTTDLELQILEVEFAKCDKPSISERERISELISTTDVDGPGMNGREIQVWFQNKRQAIRRAQGAYPLCDSTGDQRKDRMADELLFGVKLDASVNEQTSPPGSYSSVEDSSSSQLGHVTTPTLRSQHRMPTPTTSSVRPTRDRRAQLVLSDVGDGHAELMFSPTPLKPSSPPRIPLLITPIRTPLSRKIAARSASSPALLSFRTPNTSIPKRDPKQSETIRTPLQPSRASNVSDVKSLKRSHSAVQPHTSMAKTHKKRPSSNIKSPLNKEIGRGKENIPPSQASHTQPSPRTSMLSDHHGEDSHGRDIRRIQTEMPRPSWQQAQTVMSPVHEADSSTQGTSKDSVPGEEETRVHSPAKGHTRFKKLSAEECALSLVLLAHGEK